MKHAHVTVAESNDNANLEAKRKLLQAFKKGATCGTEHAQSSRDSANFDENVLGLNEVVRDLSKVDVRDKETQIVDMAKKGEEQPKTPYSLNTTKQITTLVELQTETTNPSSSINPTTSLLTSES